eukprot:6438252-Prymnesium_polylepis.1
MADVETYRQSLRFVFRDRLRPCGRTCVRPKENVVALPLVCRAARGGWDFVAGPHAGNLTMASRITYHYLPTYPRTQIWM